MAEPNLEDLQVALQVALRPIHNGLADLSSRVDGLRTNIDGLRTGIDGLRTRVDGLASEMANVRTRVDGLASEMVNVRIRVDGLPLLGVAVETLRQDVRMTRAAINDMARVNITAGEVEAMHTDIDRTMARQDEIERRLVTLERLSEQRPQEHKSPSFDNPMP
jgi:archaellum component FlaC